ncbi:MAG: aminotransferase class V-fold PLP-dependent enzyme [Acidobacteria bacterium]|nr:aminotransferase class V-fold PLP-dependent enzyme [Acidobacteriota bacterium]
MRRRDVFSSAAAAAMFGLPANAAITAPPALPDEKLLSRDPDRYWKRVREEQFLLPNWRAFLNNGSLGIAPRPVVKAVADYLHASAALEMDYYPRWGYELFDEYRQELADFYGCKQAEIAFLHNATEAMCTIANGIDLKAGDEVLLTNQEHPSGRGCWQIKAARFGVTLREVEIPIPPKSAAQLADVVTNAIGPRTKVISFSGVLTTTGLIMPVKEICDYARSKGVISVVDGAHMHGQIPFRISELGCDYMAGSPHKWAYAPAGCGLLYVREENLSKLWPSIASGSWNEQKLNAARFMNVGTNNRAIFEGMMAGLRFLKQLGPERVYARIHELARYTYQKASESKHVELQSAVDDRLYGCLISIKHKRTELEPFHEALKKKRIWAVLGPKPRLSSHIHTRKQDIDLYFETMNEAFG